MNKCVLFTTLFITLGVFIYCTILAQELDMRKHWYDLVYSNIFLVPAIFWMHVKMSEGKIVRYCIEYFLTVILFASSSIYHVYDSSCTHDSTWKFWQNLDFYFSYLTICSMIMHFANIEKWHLKIPTYVVSGSLVIVVTSIDIHATSRIVCSLGGAMLFVISHYLYRCRTMGCLEATRKLDLIDLTITFVLIIIAAIGQFVIEKPYWLVHSYMWHLGIQLAAYFAVESEYRDRVFGIIRRTVSRTELYP